MIRSNIRRYSHSVRDRFLRKQKNLGIEVLKHHLEYLVQMQCKHLIFPQMLRTLTPTVTLTLGR